MSFTIASTQAKAYGLKLMELTKKEGLQPGDPRWDGTEVTHCNEYLFEASILLGFDCSPLLEYKGIGWTNANMMYINAREEMVAGTLIVHDALSAQRAANRGKFVAALAYNMYEEPGHVAVVMGNTGFFSKACGPRIVQAGSKNGSFWLNEIFNDKELTAPLFVELEKL